MKLINYWPSRNYSNYLKHSFHLRAAEEHAVADVTSLTSSGHSVLHTSLALLASAHWFVGIYVVKSRSENRRKEEEEETEEFRGGWKQNKKERYVEEEEEDGEDEGGRRKIIQGEQEAKDGEGGKGKKGIRTPMRRRKRRRKEELG